MKRDKARKPRHLLVEPRVVLQRERTERVEAAVDRVILLRQPGEMAHDLRLAEPGKADRAAPFEPAQARAEGRRFGQIDAAMAGRILLEEERLLDLQPAVAAHRADRLGPCGGGRAQRLAPLAHCSPSLSAAANRSISSDLTISVAATNSTSASSARPRSTRLPRVPATIPPPPTASPTRTPPP